MLQTKDQKAKETLQPKKGQEKPIVHIAKKLRLTMLTDPLVLPSRDLPQDFSGLIRYVAN